ncbi:MAG: hypothetical protein IJW49_04945 [Clostridia bacterium]|nr:hypothetical protein [Clostridia bacterium]
MSMSILSIVVIVGCLMLAIAATVLAFIFIVPDKRRNNLPGLLRVAHDLFNFKYLIVEKIMQALYIFSTLYTILYGFFTIFTAFDSYTYRVYDGFGEYHYETSYEWYGWRGLIIMILGPILLRLAYEGIMLIILLVKNVIQINNKLKNQNEGEVASMFDIPKIPLKKDDAPVETEAQAQPAPSFCTQCGTMLDANGNCPTCSNYNTHNTL